MIDDRLLQVSPQADDCYAFLEWQSNEVTRSLVGFTGLITPVPDNLSSAQWQSLASPLRNDQGMAIDTLELFSSSLKGLVTPAIAELFLREIPPYLASYHRDIVSAAPIHTPMFFRTDEAVLGKIVEVQSPGSLWGTYEQLQDYYRAHGFSLGTDLSEKWATALAAEIGKPPIIHHFFNLFWASESYFAQKAQTICPLLWIRQGGSPARLQLRTRPSLFDAGR